MVKTCVICGKKFTPPSNVAHCQKTCSSDCSHEIARQTKKRRREEKFPLMTKACAACGKNFQTRSEHKITCSPECSKRYNREIRTRCIGINPDNAVKTVDKPAGKNICQQCGKPFTPDYPTEKFCSDKCRFTFFSPPLRMAIGKLFGAG